MPVLDHVPSTTGPSRWHLRQQDGVIQGHIVTQPRVTLAPFGCLPFHLNDRDREVSCLLEMQIAIAAHLHQSAFLILQRGGGFRFPMSLFALALKDGTIFGDRTAWVDAHTFSI